MVLVNSELSHERSLGDAKILFQLLKALIRRAAKEIILYYESEIFILLQAL